MRKGVNMDGDKQKVQELITGTIEVELIKHGFTGKYPEYYRIDEKQLEYVRFFLSKGKEEKSLTLHIGRFPKNIFPGKLKIVDIRNRYEQRNVGELFPGPCYWIEQMTEKDIIDKIEDHLTNQQKFW